jgi:hypothetical protein
MSHEEGAVIGLTSDLRAPVSAVVPDTGRSNAQSGRLLFDFYLLAVVIRE